jgi:hypothetical protein
VKNDSGIPLADSHNILNRWKNYFSQLFHVHWVSDVRQIEISGEGNMLDSTGTRTPSPLSSSP